MAFLAVPVTPDSPAAAANPGIAHAVYSLDPTDDEALAAYATDIIVGRVLTQTGAAGAPTSAPGQELPQSQFSVEVLTAIKGDANGVITVNQVGGFDRQAGHMLLVDGDALLRLHQTELFLLYHIPDQGWYQIVAAGHGHRPVDDPSQREALAGHVSQVAASADAAADPTALGRREGP